MPSLQFTLYRALMRVMRRYQARFPVQDADALVRFRRRADRVADLMMRLPRGVEVENASVGGVGGDWLMPKGVPRDPVMVFLHGGGTVFGWGTPNRRILAHVAKFSGLRAFGVDYRLAPEHTYPAAHDEAFAVYQALVRGGSRIVLIGESSGGVLALATMLRARAAGLPQPLLCAFISPMGDYGLADEQVWQADDPFVHPNFIVGLHTHYVAGHDVALPDLSPVHADLSGLAPLYILAAEHDILRYQAERLADVARRHALEVEVVFWPHVWHGWHVLVPQLPEATRALRAVGEMISQRVRRQEHD